MTHNRSSFVNRTRFQTKMGKVYTRFRPKRRKNSTLWGHTYLYGLYKGVPFECYFTEVIPPNNFWWLSRSPPPLLSSFSKRIWVVPPLNPSKDFSDPPFWVLSYDRSPLLFSNSASFSTKGIKLDIICFYRARLLCETAHRGTTRNLRNRRNLKKWLFLLQIPLAKVTKQLVTIPGIIDRLFTVPYYQQRSSRSSAHRLGATL